jgi:hypothetical protein
VHAGGGGLTVVGSTSPIPASTLHGNPGQVVAACMYRSRYCDGICCNASPVGTPDAANDAWLATPSSRKNTGIIATAAPPMTSHLAIVITSVRVH